MQTFLWLGEEYDIWKDFGGWYFGSFMVFFSWAALYYGVKFYLALQRAQEQRYIATQNMQEEQLKRLLAETGSRDAQIKMLRYQLNPHFLFNTLNSISALVKTKRSEQARTMISQLSDFLRFSLDNDASQMVNLASEVKALKLYLDIEKVRYGDRLKLKFNIDDAAYSSFVPSLILQPLIENALKFAVAGRVEGGTIHVSARVDSDKLFLTVEDSGSGLDASAHKNDPEVSFSKGVGLKNITDRLQSHYGDAADLKFERSKLGGLSARIVLPLEPVQALEAAL
ncbi:sensor histidine kinase [Litorimonas sp. RW-G-Af-16]|uniref:sensor histidine kinase n=1 Tax=Litorimonas sp. RW-G-Af-16 TaxID=3241168 RepID=UPI00390CAC76